MEEFRAIEFQQTRDFGKKVNVTFEFVRQNFKPLVKSIFVIAGPAVLLGSLFLGLFFASFFATTLNTHRDPQETLRYVSSVSFWLRLGLMYLFLFLSYVVTLATINGYAELYFRKRTNQIELGEIWESVRALIWKYFGSALLFLVCACILVIVIVAGVAVFRTASGFFVGLWFMASFIGIIYLAIGVSLLFFIQAHEGLNFFQAAARSLWLIRGKWWSTFGLTFILALVGVVISYIFIIPFYVYMGISMAHGVTSGGNPEMSDSMRAAMFVFFAIYYMAQMLLQALPQLGLVFQYFNLVERREARGLIDDINQFGKPDQTNP
jgi:hypothetical protein